jgi:hypothetical protein
MPTSYKEAEVQGTAGVDTWATLYDTSGTNVTAVVGTILVCNTAAAAATFRIAVMGSAGTPAAINRRAWDASIPSNETLTLPWGLAMQNARYIRVSSSADTVTFAAEVSEMTP